MKYMKLFLAAMWVASFFCMPSLSQCRPKPIKIAVIDTGFGYNGLGKGAHLCKAGHRDFTNQDGIYANVDDVLVPLDTIGHGTNVVGIIQDQISKENPHLYYCIIIFKFYDEHAKNGANLVDTIQALHEAINLSVNVVNYSGGGNDPSNDEKMMVEIFLNRHGILVAAAGNDSRDISVTPYYPASYDSRIVVVGGLTKDGKQMKYSNYGKPVNRWELGFGVSGYGINMSGTSQATAMATGKIVGRMKNTCDIGK